MSHIPMKCCCLIFEFKCNRSNAYNLQALSFLRYTRSPFHPMPTMLDAFVATSEIMEFLTPYWMHVRLRTPDTLHSCVKKSSPNAFLPIHRGPLCVERSFLCILIYIPTICCVGRALISCSVKYPIIYM